MPHRSEWNNYRCLTASGQLGEVLKDCSYFWGRVVSSREGRVRLKDHIQEQGPGPVGGDMALLCTFYHQSRLLSLSRVFQFDCSALALYNHWLCKPPCFVGGEMMTLCLTVVNSASRILLSVQCSWELLCFNLSFEEGQWSSRRRSHAIAGPQGVFAQGSIGGVVSAECGKGHPTLSPHAHTQAHPHPNAPAFEEF